jgi:hypothetical protein
VSGRVLDPEPAIEEADMKRSPLAHIPNLSLSILGALLFSAVLAVSGSRAADPDRYVFEPDHFDEQEFEEQLELHIESALEGLESLDGLGEDLEFLSDEIGEMIEEALRESAVHVDRRWPDRIWINGDAADLHFDSRRFARQMERMSRQIERSMRRGIDVHRGPDGGVRVWRLDDHARDRRDLEAEMRELQSQMRELQRQLDDLESEGDI